MAEEEKINHHAKQALRSLTNKKKKWKERIKDFLYEIFIIIVAVSITLWFHNWSDKRQDRVLEKNFLIGTRNDLVFLDTGIISGIKYMQPTLDYYDSAITQMDNGKMNAPFLDTHASQLLNTLYFTFDNSRYASFSSSGYLRLIENPELSSLISRLYIVMLPFTQKGDEMIFNERLNDYQTYIGSKTGYEPSTHAVPIAALLIKDPAVQFHVRKYGEYLNEATIHKLELKKNIENIISEIDKELKERFDIEPPVPPLPSLKWK
jgi:hypothetical protein